MDQQEQAGIAQPGPGPLGGHRQHSRRPGVSLVMGSGALLTAQLLLILTAPGFVGTRVLGEVTIGLVLLAAQVLLLLAAAVWYDRPTGHRLTLTTQRRT